MNSLLFERYQLLSLHIKDFQRDLRKVLKLFYKNGDYWKDWVGRDVYFPYVFLYDKFNSNPPRRVKKGKLRNRLEWVIIIVGGLLCGWILWIDRGGVR